MLKCSTQCCNSIIRAFSIHPSSWAIIDQIFWVCWMKIKCTRNVHVWLADEPVKDVICGTEQTRPIRPVFTEKSDIMYIFILFSIRARGLQFVKLFLDKLFPIVNLFSVLPTRCVAQIFIFCATRNWKMPIWNTFVIIFIFFKFYFYININSWIPHSPMHDNGSFCNVESGQFSVKEHNVLERVHIWFSISVPSGAINLKLEKWFIYGKWSRTC